VRAAPTHPLVDSLDSRTPRLPSILRFSASRDDGSRRLLDLLTAAPLPACVDRLAQSQTHGRGGPEPAVTLHIPPSGGRIPLDQLTRAGRAKHIVAGKGFVWKPCTSYQFGHEGTDAKVHPPTPVVVLAYVPLQRTGLTLALSPAAAAHGSLQ